MGPIMGAPGTTGSHLTSSHVIWLFLEHPLDVIRPIGSSYLSNNVDLFAVTNDGLVSSFLCHMYGLSRMHIVYDLGAYMCG